MFKCITQLIGFYTRIEVKHICVEIFQKLKAFFNKNCKQIDFPLGDEIYNCLFSVLEKIGWYENLDERSLNKFVDSLLIYALRP